MAEPAPAPPAVAADAADARLRARMLAPWGWLLATTTVCAVIARLYGEHTVGRGASLDLMLEGAVIGVVSIFVMWAPMLSMRVARRAWPRLDPTQRRATARFFLALGLTLGPLFVAAVYCGTDSLPVARLLGPSLTGCLLVTLGGFASLWLRRGAT